MTDRVPSQQLKANSKRPEAMERREISVSSKFSVAKLGTRNPKRLKNLFHKNTTME